jgi:hypothetical protein
VVELMARDAAGEPVPSAAPATPAWSGSEADPERWVPPPAAL